MKKSLWIVLLVVITLLLCGCERKTTPKEEVSAPLIETDPCEITAGEYTMLYQESNWHTKEYYAERPDQNFLTRQDAVPDAKAAVTLAMAAAKTVPGGDKEGNRPTYVFFNPEEDLWTVWIDDHPYDPDELGCPLVVVMQKADGKILYIGV